MASFEFLQHRLHCDLWGHELDLVVTACTVRDLLDIEDS